MQNKNNVGLVIQFYLKKLGFIKVKGTFHSSEGIVAVTKNDFETSNVEIAIETKSIDTNSVGRDRALQKSEFFDSKNFPRIQFMSTLVKETSNGLVVEGILKIKGIEKKS